MRVLILNGSPRKGTTEKVLNAFLDVFESMGFSVEYLSLSNLSISPCNECLSCYIREGCIIMDAMTGIYEKLKTADIVVFASPVFFSGPTAQMKAMIDRLQALWAIKNKIKKQVRGTSPMVIGVVVGARGSEIDLKNTVSIFKAAASSFNGNYAGTFSYLRAESPDDLPEFSELKLKIEDFIRSCGL